MKRKSESKVIVVDLVPNLRMIQDTVYSACDSTSSVTSVLETLFKKTTETVTLTALSSLEGAPPGIEWITMRFLEWLSQSTTLPTSMTALLVRLQNARHNQPDVTWDFRWKVRNTLDDITVPAATESVYSCLPKALTKIEAVAFPVPNRLYIACLTHGNFAFKHQHQHGWIPLAKSDDPNYSPFAHAHRSFMGMMTKFKFVKAMEPLPGREVYVYGNWVDAKEYYSTPAKLRDKVTILKAEDDRTSKLFVHGWPSIGKDKEVFIIKRARSRRTPATVDPLDFDLTIEGEATLNSSLSWGVHNLKQYVAGYVMCHNCWTIGGAEGLSMRWSPHKGAMCCVCTDYHLEDTQSIVDTGIF